MNVRAINRALTFCISVVWIANGLFCKVLNLVPRHSEIVARIIGEDFSGPLTVLIGCSEIVMAMWILSGFKSRINALTQIAVVGTMNILEFVLASDLLLWGKWNALFAFMFVIIVYFNEFYLNKKQGN